MTCDQAHELIFDARTTAALAEHLQGCPACAAAAAAHAQAIALQIEAGPALRPLEVAEIRQTVGRRRSARLGVASAAALIVLFLAVRHAPAPTNALPVSAPLDMARLLTEVDGFMHVDVEVADPAYAPFGPMASWFALPESDKKCSASKPLSIDCFSASEDLPE